MKRVWRIALIVLAVLLFLLLVGPLLVPIPPLRGTVPPQQLADPDSRFVEVNGLAVHYKTAGEGDPALLLLHGFGASLFSWREVMEPLGEQARVIAFDRPAFGLTERPLEWEGPNPYSQEAQSDLTVALMDELGVERAVLVGHSAGGTIALLTALRHPERVEALILVAPAVYESGPPGWLRPLLRTPQVRRLGPLLVRSIARWGTAGVEAAWYDPTRLTSEILAGYERPLQAENWDQALWAFTLANQPLNLAQRLEEITVPVLIVSGDADTFVPSEQSARLAGQLPNAELVQIAQCGHLPHEEQPAAFLQAVRGFLHDLP